MSGITVFTVTNEVNIETDMVLLDRQVNNVYWCSGKLSANYSSFAEETINNINYLAVIKFQQY